MPTPLLIGMTLVAMPYVYVAHESRAVMERKGWYSAHPVNVEIDISDVKSFKRFSHGDQTQGPSWLRIKLGDEPRRRIYVMPTTTTAEKKAAAAIFPEAEIVEIPRGYP